MKSIDNIEEYLKTHENKEMLRFITCGSVDDGKSTLIGRLLYDSKMIFEDQLSAAESESAKYGTTGGKLDLALLVDGLQSEREQGITIDVAYRFFATDKRKYIIADTPGHEQYTRNMVTGASTADVAVILIDARKGILTQTRRHSYIVNLVGIEHIVVAINKMDLVGFSQEIFEMIKSEYNALADELGIRHRYFIPMSALDGDNVVHKSKKTPWFTEQPLLELLDTIEYQKSAELQPSFRFPVQYVNRPHLNFRGFCGSVASGTIKIGEEITVLPSGKTTRIKSIINAGDITENDREIITEQASAPMAITLTTEDEVDISRGDMIVKTEELPRISNTLKVMVVWFDESAMEIGKTYDIKRSTTLLSGHFEHINYKVDVNTYERTRVDKLQLNDIASCKLILTRPIAADKYRENRQTGSFIIIDRITNNTVGAGMIVDVAKRESDTIGKQNIFEIWNENKQKIDKAEKLKTFSEREIVFIYMGKNIGFEQDGKGKEFLRPVLVYKKFNKEQFLGFALTSQKREGKFYVEVRHGGRTSYVMLSQLRTYSAKRIKYKTEKKITDKKMQEVHEKFVRLITPR